MTFKLRSGNKTSFKEMGSDKSKGKGFMHPPYKKPVGPVEKPGVHGYKNFKSNIESDEDFNLERMQNQETASEIIGHQMHVKKSPNKATINPDGQIVEGVLCDAYGNPRPSDEQIKAGTASPDFRNKAKKGKQEKGLGPAFGDTKAEQKAKTKTDEKSEEARKAEIKAQKKKQDAKTMEDSINMTLGKNK